MSVPVALAWVAIQSLSLYGWGAELERGIGLASRGAPVTVALGLALWVALGGLLNAVHLAVAPAIGLLAAAGLGLAVVHLRTRRPRIAPSPIDLVALTLTLLVLSVMLATLVPDPIFNPHDDFQKYFVHPVRMLQTGSVYGSPLSAIGSETLGGQAWLHAPLIVLAGPSALNALDPGFGLALCLALAGLGPGGGRGLVLARGVAMLALLVYDPQVVNVSAVYVGAALCLALVLLNLGGTPDRAHGIATGLLCAALCAIKTTFAVPVVLAVVALAAALALERRALVVAVRWLLACGASLALFLAPWLLVHAGHYLQAVTAPVRPPVSVVPRAAYVVDPLSTAPTLYGRDSLLMWSVAVTCCLGVGVAGYLARRRAGGAERWAPRAALALAASVAVLYPIMLFVLGPFAPGLSHTVRLFVPVLLGVASGVLILVLAGVERPGRGSALPLLLAVAPLLPFVPGVAPRLLQAVEHGSVDAFLNADNVEAMQQHSREVLAGPMRSRLSAAQATIPRGEPVVTWISAPFLLDFRQNPIVDADRAGLITPWARVPDASYVIWEHDGWAIVPLSAFLAERHGDTLWASRTSEVAARLLLVLGSFARDSEPLYDDGQIMVLRLPRPTALRERLEHLMATPMP